MQRWHIKKMKVFGKKFQQNTELKIYISCHKRATLPSGSLYQPIQVGAALAKERLPHMLHDDEGENISERNGRYCELTAQYWAWKHDTADYVGFCHYRRFFSFAPEHVEANELEGIIRKKLTRSVCNELHLNDTRRILEVVHKADVWLTDPVSFEGTGLGNLYRQYGDTKDLHEEDLQTAVAVLKEQHPEFSNAADECLNGQQFSARNMFIMKREIFDRYCQWLFPILEETDRRIDYTGYTTYALRTIGHIAERLLGVFCTYLRQNEPECRIDYLQYVFLGKIPSMQLPRPPIYRLFNPHTREYFFTINEAERDALMSCGWRSKGVRGYASRRGTPVYRLVNDQTASRRFTPSQNEIAMLASKGWRLEGIAWCEEEER